MTQQKILNSVEGSVSKYTLQWARKVYAAVGKKIRQIQIVISRVKEELEKRCFRHLMQPLQGFLMLIYLLFKIYSYSNLQWVHKIS
jgi:hypothetical protein